MHYVMIQPRQDPQVQWLMTHILLTEEELEAIVHEWTKEWCVPILEDQITANDLEQDKLTSSQQNDQENYPQDNAQDRDLTHSRSSSTSIDQDVQKKRKEDDIDQGESK